MTTELETVLADLKADLHRARTELASVLASVEHPIVSAEAVGEKLEAYVDAKLKVALAEVRAHLP